MKIKKLIHHLLLTIGFTLGAIITGTTINARAQQINQNTDNTTPNNQDVNINNNQIKAPKDNLVNVPNQDQVKINNNYYNKDSDYYNPKASQTNANRSYNLNDNPKYKINPNPNKNNNEVNSSTINQKTNKIYNNIILRMSKSNKDNSLKPEHFVEYTNNNSHKLRFPTIHLGSLSKRSNRHHQNWFRDGLNKRNLKARSWISWHESNHRWHVLSYGHICVGYFQLNPAYLGYRHGHVNLNKKHQVKVADAYVRGRYGNWINAKRFWKIHHWY